MRNREIRTIKRNFKRYVIWGRKRRKKEKMWFHSKNVVTVGVRALLEKRRGSRPLCNYYYIIKSNNSNSLGEVTACIVHGI